MNISITRLRSTLLLMCVFMLFGFSHAIAQQEPVNGNGDFSQGEVGQTEGFTGWISEAVEDSEVNFTIVEAPDEAGNNVMSIEIVTFPDGANPWNVQLIGVAEDNGPFVMVPGEDYEVSLRMRTNGGTGSTDITLGNPDFQEYFRTSAEITEEWQEFTYTFTNDGHAEDFNDTEGRLPLHFGFASNEGLIFYLDDVSVTPLTDTSTEPRNTPNSFVLEQNYPNPFNPTTNISYEIGESSPVTLEVFNVLGKRVATLVNGQTQSAGAYTVSFDAANLTSGVYMYRLSTGSQTFTRTMTLMK